MEASSRSTEGTAAAEAAPDPGAAAAETAPGPSAAAVPDRGAPVVGIACSGGGIRAASFALGGLQVLDDHGLLRGRFRARYLSAVSGGSYMVGGWTGIQKSREALAAGEPDVAAIPPFAPDSPEVLRLRNRLGYLTHGPGGIGPELYRVGMGIAVNVTALLTFVATLGRPAGWVLGWLVPQVRWGCANAAYSRHAEVCRSTAVPVPGWVWPLLAVLVGISVAVALWAALRRGGGRPMAWRVAASFLFAAFLVAVGVIVVPQAVGWLHRTRVHDIVGASVSGVGRHFAWVPASGFAGVLAAIAAAAAPVWRFFNPARPDSASNTPGGPEGGSTAASMAASAPGAQAPPVPGSKLIASLKGWALRHRGFLLNLAASIAGPVMVLGGLLLFVYRGASSAPGVLGGGGSFEIVRWVWPAVVLAVLAAVGDVNGWALHSLYAQRLGDAFGIERVPSTAPVVPVTAPFSPATYPQPSSPTAVGPADAQERATYLSLADAQPLDFPEVIICATANLGEYGVTPTDQKSASFVLSSATVGGAATGCMATPAYVDKAFGGGTHLSLVDAVSISGAAVAPEMGKMTRAPLRFLLALANVRLGVWVPNPTRVQDDASYAAMFRRPGLTYLAREMAGRTPRRSRFVYVSDGGHYDNLGLVELLRRRCDWVFAMDASGDAIDTFSTLGQALAIAQAELGVTVDIDPLGAMAPLPDQPSLVRSTFCRGTIHYPASADAPAKDATLVVVKAGVPADAPWDVGSYHQANPRFPCDPTSDQLYNAPRFDAYVSLGRFSMRQAWGAWGPDLEIAQGRSAGPTTPLQEATPLTQPPPSFSA